MVWHLEVLFLSCLSYPACQSFRAQAKDLLFKEALSACPCPQWDSDRVTESGFRLLTAQTPINRPSWGEGKFALFQMPATRGIGQTSVQRLTPQPLNSQGGKSFYRHREGATCRNSTASPDSRLEIGPRWSDQHYLGCFGYSSPPSLEVSSQNCSRVFPAAVGYHVITFPTCGGRVFRSP